MYRLNKIKEKKITLNQMDYENKYIAKYFNDMKLKTKY